MKNKPVIIVTGASRGLGAAISCWLGKAGAGVTLIARSEEKLAQIAYYIDLKERGDLAPPKIPGRSIAWLALHAPLHFRSQFLDYDDPRIHQPALEFFGNGIH